jgi:hypothetical protein
MRFEKVAKTSETWLDAETVRFLQPTSIRAFREGSRPGII